MDKLERISQDLDVLINRNNDELVSWGAGGARKFTVTTLFVMAGLQRIASNAHGFTAMVQARNYPIVGAILRMQIDTAMRLYGLRLMKNMEDGATLLLAGGKYSAIKGKDGRPLHDAVLIEALQTDHPWVKEVYRRTSGMTHLSGTHIHHALDHQNRTTTEEGALSVVMVISPTGPELPDSLFEECGDAFLHASMIASAEALAFLRWEAEVFDNAPVVQ